MIVEIFSVYDVKAAAYAPPFYMQKKGLALRAFSDEVLNPKSMISIHPSDYSLFYLGTYDDNSGKIQSVTPLFLTNGSDCIADLPSKTLTPSAEGVTADDGGKEK